MKKLLGIVILVLFLSGNVNSNDKVEVLKKVTTVNDLLNEGYILSSTNVLPSKNYDSPSILYHLIKDKKLVTCVLRSGNEDKNKNRFVVQCLKP